MYFCDFTNNLDGWTGYGHVTHQGGAGGHFMCGAPFDDDMNHSQSVGPMLLLAVRYLEIPRPDGSFQPADVRGRLLRARFRFENWPQISGQRLLPWAQARIPGTGPNWKYSNWAMTGFNDSGLFDGNFHDVEALYSVDPTKWIYAFGGDPNLYAEASLDVTLANIHNIILVHARPTGTTQPTGKMRMDWISIGDAP